jgi:DNA topoisomerase-3
LGKGSILKGDLILMANTLVIAEKPSVGKDIARVLGCKFNKNGYIEGKKYIVTWALGHLVTLADPGSYDKKYSNWRLEDIPIIPERFRLTIIKNSIAQFNKVRELLSRNNINNIVIATDAGREGELVARWIIDKTKTKKTIKRLWISSVTDKAIKDGFNNLKDGNKYFNLYQAAYARAEADWLVGINASRALTCKYNAQLSCGRVQTPTLQMILMRENEIKKFVSKKFFTLKVKIKNHEFTWFNKNNESRIFDKELLNSIISDINGKQGLVIKTDKKIKHENPPKLYNLTELQREANKAFGYSTKKTLGLMQVLYERHKVLTYPRTDSRYLSDDIVGTIKDRLSACRSSSYAKFVDSINKNGFKSNSNFIDNKKVTDHHAIIPTEHSIDISELSRDEFKIYDLVVKRFFAVLYSKYSYELNSVSVKIGEHIFKLSFKNDINIGWKEVYSSKDEINNKISNFNEKESVKIESVIKTEGKTSPPSLFSEGELISAMENPNKYINNSSNELKKVLNESGGIGTVATRADSIEKLFDTGLMEKRGKEIYITAKGKQLLNLVPGDLKSPMLTAKWEKKLKDIENGNLKRNNFIKEMESYTKKVVKEIKDNDYEFKHDNVTTTKCENCGSLMLEIKNKRGKLLVCKDRNCNFKKVISQTTNFNCPKCRRKIEMFGEGEKSVYVCKCGFKEKKVNFEKRLKNAKKSVSKKDVDKFLHKQKIKEQSEINNPMFEALSKLKFNKD